MGRLRRAVKTKMRRTRCRCRAPLQACGHKSAKSRLRARQVPDRRSDPARLSSIRLRSATRSGTRGKAARFNGARPSPSSSFAIKPGAAAKTCVADLGQASRWRERDGPDYGSVIDYRCHYCHRIIALFATGLEDTALMRAIVSVVLPRSPRADA